MTNEETENETRILILPPTRRDGEVTSRLLLNAGLHSRVCAEPLELAREISRGAGALLLTESILAAHGMSEVLDALRQQESWSDIPIVMMLHGGAPSAHTIDVLALLTNVTLLERPAPTRTVVSAVEAALRARQKQYQIREQFKAIQHAELERQRLLESEQAARREAERASRIKDEFLATLSHELRTPLNAIFGWAQVLKMAPSDSEKVSQAVAVIDRNVRVQTQLIEDLLDMSRIISGKIRLDIKQIELSEVIQAALDSAKPAAEVKGIRLETIVQTQVGSVSGDFGRLQQVFWNLLSNAIKFTPKQGRIQVLAERVNSHVEVSVTDTGEGMDPEFVPHLFERFSQADGSITRRHGGLGIGLSIVKNLVELHGGSVRAESPGRGGGATFIVRLPLRVLKASETLAPDLPISAEAPIHSEDFHKLRGIKVLVVDDELDSRELVKRFLTDRNAIAALAASVADAQSLVVSFAPDVIVSDIGMPGQDGYEFIRSIRNSGVQTPAIALTAFARAEDRIRSLQAGYHAHLTKPVEPSELLAMIVRLHESRAG